MWNEHQIPQYEIFEFQGTTAFINSPWLPNLTSLWINSPSPQRLMEEVLDRNVFLVSNVFPCIGDKHSSINDTEIFEKIFEDQRKILLEIFLACLLNRVAERIVKKDTNWKFIIF